MKIFNYFNPWSSEFHACRDFTKLSGGYIFLTVLTVALASLASLGIAAVPVFRLLVREFTHLSKKSPEDDSEAQKKAKEIDEAARRALGGSSGTSAAKPTAATGSASPRNWKSILRDDLSRQLAARSKKCEDTQENGDCFFEAVAKQLNRAKLKTDYTAKHVRMDLSRFLQGPAKEKYRDLYRGDVDATYDEICTNIQFCKDEITTGAPIWGNGVIAKMVADLYGVSVNIRAMDMIPVSFLDLMDGGLYAGFHHHVIDQINQTPEVCTLLDKTTYRPESGHASHTLELANISRGPWGHFVSVVPI